MKRGKRVQSGLMLVVLCMLVLPVGAWEAPDTIVIAGTGDIMMGTDYPSARYLPPRNDCSGLFSYVKGYLERADVAFGNLEGSMAGNHGKAKVCRDTANCYVFRMPEHFVSCLVDAGFDLVSVANNHSGDFGPGGRLRTAQVLNSAGISFAGFIDNPSVIIERKGLKIGLCAFSPSEGTPSVLDIQAAEKIVSGLAAACDIVIVSMHAGAEGKDHQRVTRKNEMFLGYSRGNVYEFAHRMVDAGADIVFGHGPHVTRAVELYRERLIAYSLGNFCTYSRFNLQGPNGIAPLLLVHTGPSGQFLKAEVIPVIQRGPGIPEIDTEKRAVRKLAELTSLDFPGSDLVISENGMITRRTK